MTLDPLLITLIILAAAVILFITDRVRVDVVALCVLVALMASGILTTGEALAGFSSTAVISIAALFITGGAVFQTGLASMAADRILDIAGGSQRRLLLVLMVAIAVMSAFISSTGVVALMLPAIISLANRTKTNTSRLLLPLAYSALLGGALTLIGTPPNVIVTETLQNAGYAPFTLFSFTPMGVVLLLVGLLFVLLPGRRLLPNRAPVQEMQQFSTPGELFRIYMLPDNLFRLRVQEDSPLIGKSLEASGLRRDFDISILEIAPAAAGTHNGRARRSAFPRPEAPQVLRNPAPQTVLQQDAVLLVRGSSDNVARVAGYWKLAVMATDPVVENDIITNEVGIAEVLLRPRSSLLGKTVAEVHFGSAYHLTVLDLRRPGVETALDIKSTPLKFGDMLLVQGEWKHIFALKRLRQDFVVMGEREAAEAGAFTRREKAPLTLLIVTLMVCLIAFNIADLTLASLFAAVALVLTGCVSMDEAYTSIDWKSLVLIAGMLPMSTALVKVGAVELIANGVITLLGQYGAVPVLTGIFVLTVLLTQVISNTATTVLVAPVALATAQGLGVQPQAFLMATAIAASMAFATPIASPVNTLVMTAGNYRFGDYARAGLPLIVLCLLASVLLLPLLFPL